LARHLSPMLGTGEWRPFALSARVLEPSLDHRTAGKSLP
jgi:hypothetical protein